MSGRRTLLDQLADAASAITESEARIYRQKQLIAKQQRPGKDIMIANEILDLLLGSRTCT
jgi:hypothetical protein